MNVFSKITRTSPSARKAIDKAQHRREVIVCIAQVMFAANVLFLFLLTTPTTNTRLLLHPTVILFVTYLSFIFWYLRQSSNRKLTWHSTVISIVLDFILCMQVLLYLYSKQHTVESIVSAPMFSYVYLFIAIRCLHFRSRYVVIAGASAATCWLTLVALTMSSEGSLNKDVLRTMTMTDVFLLGYVDKLLSIAGTTFVLSFCTSTAKRYFETSIARAVAGQGLSRFLSHEIASEIIKAGGSIRPGHGKMRRAAILMMDIRNFTNIASSISPSQVMALLKDYQSRMVPKIENHGGCIDKFMGDGILAHFGAVTSSRTYAADALNAVEALNHCANCWNRERRAMGLTPLKFGIACTIGDVVFGAVGGRHRMEFTIIGDAVNLTAKLEKHTKRLGVRALTTIKTYDKACEQGFIAQYLAVKKPRQKISGLDHTVDLVVLCETERSIRAKHQHSSGSRKTKHRVA